MTTKKIPLFTVLSVAHSQLRLIMTSSKSTVSGGVMVKSWWVVGGALVGFAALLACGDDDLAPSQQDAGADGPNTQVTPIDNEPIDGGGEASSLPPRIDDGIPPIAFYGSNPTPAQPRLVLAGNDIYAIGFFRRVSRYPANGIAMLNPSGEMSRCRASFDVSGVRAIVRFANSLFLGGTFTNYNGKAANRIVKIDAVTCASDPAFNSGTGFNGAVNTFALIDDALFVGGAFNSYNGEGSLGGIAKINANTGAINTAFSSSQTGGFGGGNVRVLLTNTESLFVGGSFDTYRGAPNINRIAKLNPTNGVLDTASSFNNGGGFDGDQVNALAFSGGGALFVGGAFTRYRGSESANGIAKINQTTGVLDTTFSPPANNGFAATDALFDGSVSALHVLAPYIYVAGAFNTYRGAHADSLVKLDRQTGALDTTFSPPNATPTTSAFQTITSSINGGLFVGGTSATNYRGKTGIGNIAKIDTATGALDESFRPTNHPSTRVGFDGGVSVLYSDSNRIIAGGTFTMYAGHDVSNLAKINGTTFEIDTNFKPDTALLSPRAIAISNNALYVGGVDALSTATGAVVKLDRITGTKDAAFTATFSQNGVINSLAAADDALYVGGTFHQHTSSSANCIAKLNLATGALDTTFSPPAENGFTGPSDNVESITVIGGSIYVDGNPFGLPNYRGTPVTTSISKIDRVTGVLDTNFAPVTGMYPSTRIRSVEINGALYVGGRAQSATDRAFAKLNPTTGAVDNAFAISAEVATTTSIRPFKTASALFLGGVEQHLNQPAGGVIKVDLTTGKRDTTTFPNAELPANISGVLQINNTILITGDFNSARGSYGLRNSVLFDLASGAPIP
jgi:hypothetical protein